MKEQLIKDYFYLLNGITLRIMYFKNFKNKYDISDLKDFNPGHLGSGLNINFILANLNYFLNKNKISAKKVIGTGHAGVSLISNLFMNGDLFKSYNKYSKDINGLNELINDFGIKIRSEINPQYPGVIYDGGELGYSLAVSYGYAINNDVLVPCIIGDGECETGTLSASWYLNKMIKTKGKVLPIIDLNGLKMGGKSFLSLLSNDNLRKYFESLGYNPLIVDTYNVDIIDAIKLMQDSLAECIKISNPLLIVKSKKGYTFPNYLGYNLEGTTAIHKNPFGSLSKEEKINLLNYYINYYNIDKFVDDHIFDSFITSDVKNDDIAYNEIIDSEIFTKGIEYIQSFIIKFLKENRGMVFSPDELISNQFSKLAPDTFEILNENVLQGLVQGLVHSEGYGFYIGYEGFMPLIDGMIEQFLKYLKQIDLLPYSVKIPSINYILTSDCLENTYSHQNPQFVSNILIHSDKYYNAVYPRNGYAARDFLMKNVKNNNSINILTISKRCKDDNIHAEYNDIDIIEDVFNPDIILVATGDYLLNEIYKLKEKILEKEPDKKIKLIYVSNPKILDTSSVKSLNDNSFNYYFNKDTPVIYLYEGYKNVINGLLYDRTNDFYIFGFIDEVTINGTKDNILDNNILSANKIYDKYKELFLGTNKILRRKYE